MSDFPKVLPHGTFSEVFDDVFMITGTMRNEFFGSMWQFSRNMTIVRDGDQLTLINSVRLDDAGLKELDALGKVINVVRIGDLHGIDDPFYIERYAADFWALPGMGIAETSSPAPMVNHELTVGGAMPFSDCSLFVFETTNRPEAILQLNRDGGIMIACDSLQNWVAQDEFTLDDTAEKMSGMGFFQPANLGPAWMHVNEPGKEDFARLGKLSYKHALCGHGVPLKDTAKVSFTATFKRLFEI